MDYEAFSNDSLTMMYEAVRGALAADDAVEQGGGEPRFKVRDTSDWRRHAADLEAEMLKRGMAFEVIDWHEGQEKLPSEASRRRLRWILSALRPHLADCVEEVSELAIGDGSKS